MKRALLTIAILLFTVISSDLMAQRDRQDDRRPRREEALNKRRGGQNNYRKNNRNRNRKERLVDHRVYRNRGWRNYGSSNTYGYRTVRYYDYDFRLGRRIAVNRGYRPSNRHIWVAGHWRYNPRYDRDVWVDGCWTVRRSNHRWVPGRYKRLNGNRIWFDGCWTIVY